MDNLWPPDNKEGSAHKQATAPRPLPTEAPHKTCRVHLVGVFSSDQHVHLGPYTLPRTDEQSPTLLEFATTMKRLVRVTQGQDTWWRFQYSCYGNSVPILSDDALKEAFTYFREQHHNLSPEAAAVACRLYLVPTATQPGSWNLTDYLTETGMAPVLKPRGSQSSEGRAGVQPEPSDAGTGAVAAATAAGGKGDCGVSSSSSHDASDQHMAAAAAGISSVQREEHVQPALLIAADNSSFSAREPPAQVQGWDHANGLQQQQYSEIEPTSRVAKRQAVAAVGSLEQQAWQQHQVGARQAAAAAAATPVVQQQLLSSGSIGDSRAIKAAKRDKESSPRAQWQQQQQQAMPAVSASNVSQMLLLQQQQNQAGASFVSPFAVSQAGGAGTAARVAADSTTNVAPAAMQPQKQHLLQPRSSLQGCVAAQGMTIVPPQQQQQPLLLADNAAHLLLQQLSSTPACYMSSQVANARSGQAATGVTVPAAQLGSSTQLGPGQPGVAESDTEGAGEACSLGPHVNQLQQLHLGTFSSSGTARGGQDGTAGVAAAAPAIGAGWRLHPPPQPQPQQLLAAGPGLAAQLPPAGQNGLQYHGSTGNLTMLSSEDIARSVSQIDMAAAAAAAAAAPDGAGGIQGLQLTLSAGRLKTETKTKYADGRFKDEARHQQRLNDMAKRCNALFDGAIHNQFRVEHHKRVTCMVCNAIVVPYEAYHIDAVRKHFVRHHEPWLAEQGVDVDIWRKSCAPIAKGASRSSSAGAAMTGAAAAGSSEMGGAASAAAAAELAEEETTGRRASGTRLADGRYKDPKQHAQRLADMRTRCAALFNGAMTQHWTINTHKSIMCHLCDQHITPYAAYHPDCLRKHFVRKHEDVLAAAGVDVPAWSKGIPLGRRKLKALLLQQQQQSQSHQQQQQQQQQQQHPNLGIQEEQLTPDLLLQLQEQHQQQSLQQPAQLQPASSNAVVQQPHQQQVLVQQLSNDPGAWPWALVQQPQHLESLLHVQPGRSLPMQPRQHDVPVQRTSSTSQGSGMPPAAQQQQHQHLMQLMLGASTPAVSAGCAVHLHDELPTSSMPGPLLNHLHGMQQQQQEAQIRLQQHSSFTTVTQGLPPAQQQHQLGSAAGFGSPDLPPASTPSVVTATVQFSQPQIVLFEPAQAQPTASLTAGVSDACAPMEGAAAHAQVIPAGQMDPRDKSPQSAAAGTPQVQQHPQRNSTGTAARSALAPALAAAAAAIQQPGGQSPDEGAAGENPKAPVPAAGWLHPMGEAPMSLGQTPGALAAMSMGQTPGFGAMSLSPAIGMNDLGMGGISSLTEADVAAMWEDDDADQALAELLLKHGGTPWSFGS